jgi:glycosyltransferase involved in cell wall biosynthesis
VISVPVVITHVHGRERFFRGAFKMGKFRPLGLSRRVETWFVCHWVDTILTVSESIRAECLQKYQWLDPSKVVTVRNGIDGGRFKSNPSQKEAMRQTLGIPPQDIVFGTVGRLHPDKGHHYLIEAFTRVANKIPNARLIVIGNGPLLGQLQKHAQESGIVSKVVFLGRRNDVHELLQGFDIFVFPSVEEPLGLALIEAMLSGLPVVVTDAGGLPEIIGHGGVGKQVPAGDSASLAEAMIELGLLSESERWALGKLARDRAQREFTIDSMCASLMNIYERSLKSHSERYDSCSGSWERRKHSSRPSISA